MSGDERRAQIIEAAAELFARKGFRGTKTREIAEAAGVSEAMIFKHFATKEDLYGAIIDTKTHPDNILGPAAGPAAARDDGAVLRAIGRRLVARAQADPTILRLLHFSALEGHQLSEIFFRTRFQVVLDFLAGYIAQRIADGVFRPIDPVLAAQGFIGMVAYYLQLHELFGRKRRPTETPEQAIELFVHLFLAGLRAGDGERSRT
jgi:AcrR family transcriptional regulator